MRRSAKKCTVVVADGCSQFVPKGKKTSKKKRRRVSFFWPTTTKKRKREKIRRRKAALIESPISISGQLGNKESFESLHFERIKFGREGGY